MNNPPPQPPPQQPAAPEKKKGLHPMAWVGMGCGVIMLIAVICIVLLVGFCKKKFDDFAAEFKKDPHQTVAEQIVKMSPAIEKVSEDEEAGEMTIRVKETGEEITVKYSDLASGKFTVKKSDGSEFSVGKLDLSQVPGWVPRYPNTNSEIAGVHQSTPTGVSGILSFATSDDPDAVASFYENELSELSTHSNSQATINGVTVVKHSFSGSGRSVDLTVTSQNSGDTNVQIGYEEK